MDDDSNARHGHRELPALVGGYQVLDVYDTQAGLGDKNSVETEGLALTGEYHASEFLTFKSITAGRKGHTQTLIDFDGTPLPTLDVPATYDDKSFSQELQAVYSDDTIQGVFGLYYMNSQASGEFDTIAGNLGVSIADGGKVSTQSFAAFFDVSANFTDRFKVSVGARATRDHKRSNTFRYFYLGATPAPFQGGTPRPILQVRTDYSAEKTFSEFTPRLSASYELTDDLNTYVSYSKGYKSGGWDMRGDAFLTPQTVNGYAARNGRRLRAGPEGQPVRPSRVVRLGRVPVQVQGPAGYHPGGRALGHRQLGRQRRRLHAVRGRVRSQGGVQPAPVGDRGPGLHPRQVRHLQPLRAGRRANPVNPSQTIPAGGQIVNVADLYGFQNTPEWTGNASLTWRGTVARRRAADHSDGQLPRRLPAVRAAPAGAGPEGLHPGRPDRQLGTESGRYKISVAGKNLTDERYRTGGYNFGVPTYNNSVIGFYGPPRTYSASLEVKF